MAKQYGLIISNKSKLTPINTIKKPSIFEEESESDGEVEKPTGLPISEKRQDRITREKAVEEDPTVYQYDEIYDKMEKEKKDLKLLSKEDKKPKYINRLLAAADKRKKENERRIERQVQKEREAEGDEFKDKESFVTTAYRKKLEEIKKQEEEEMREEYLEAIGDVKKQGNLDGFYRHLYDQKVNYSDKVKPNEVKAEEDDDDNAEISNTPPLRRICSSDENEDDAKDVPEPVSKKHAPQKRTYRKREDSGSEEKDEKEDEKKLEHLQSNLDADSDFSIDSDTEESDDESKPKKPKTENKTTDESKVNDDAVKLESKVKEEPKEKEDKEILAEDVKKIEEDKPKKPKINIWKKRTVGAIFDEALQRYYQRKALREAVK